MESALGGLGVGSGETEASRIKDLASISWHTPTGRPISNVIGWLEVGESSYLELLEFCAPDDIPKVLANAPSLYNNLLDMLSKTN